MNTRTPMMQQYLEMKARHPDALLLYRMGDFYELFMEDAVLASKVLEIALTSRDKQAENPVPMCGVPYHAAENYISRLIEAGHKVAVCDQVEDPKKAKGLVRREITRVITPGLLLESRNLDAAQPNYLAAVASHAKGKSYGLSYLDVSTGDFRAVEVETEETLLEELLRISPKELLLDQSSRPSWLDRALQILPMRITRLDSADFDERRGYERLLRRLKVHSLDGFGMEAMRWAIRAAGAVLAYLEANLLGACEHIGRLIPYRRADYMVLDESTVRNLEIFQSSNSPGNKTSLLGVLDRTRTPMGARKLHHWLRYPLLDLPRIRARQQAVAELVEQTSLRGQILAELDRMGDMERLNGRNSAGMSSPRDLVALKRCLQVLPAIGELLSRRHSLPHLCRHSSAPGIEGQTGAAEGTPPGRSPRPDLETPGEESSPSDGRILCELALHWDPLQDVADRIEEILTDPPPASMASGGIIRPGVDAQLDHLVRISRDAKSWMAEYEALERQRTGISSLKVRYNKVFGYYLEVSRSNLAAVPDNYVRKQTLVNAERFVTEELKKFETEILEADEKRQEIEERLFGELCRAVASQSSRINAMAERTARLDCLATLADLASKGNYCCPQLDHGDRIFIREGRHPVIEHCIPDGTFVPNDLVLDHEERQVLIITGPNMSGKSTILRQAALIVLMAQIGSFVPAAEARIGIVDRIFTRIGASDDLARGRSTFMVEMQETANILHQATSRSLVILDEIGRGTSTFDGLSIAWAVAECLHDFENTGIKTLFATHYHELTELSRTRARVKNYNVAVKEWQGEILFFHKLLPGAANRSYGIQVAQLAGMPGGVTRRAKEILTQLERGETSLMRERPAAAKGGASRRNAPTPVGRQLHMFDSSLEWLREQILSLDPDHLTPMAALQKLVEMRERIVSLTGSRFRPRQSALDADGVITSTGAKS